MKHLKRLCILAIAIASLAMTGCSDDKVNPGRYLFTLCNNSDMIVGWYIPEPTQSGVSELPEYKPASLYNEYQHIRPGEKYSFLEYEVSAKYGPSDAVKLYVFSVETLTEFTWDQIRNDNLYEYCFELRVDELKAADRKVYYPAE